MDVFYAPRAGGLVADEILFCVEKNGEIRSKMDEHSSGMLRCGWESCASGELQPMDELSCDFPFLDAINNVALARAVGSAG